MSRCLNKATLIGYLGADPEIRTTPSGARVAQFSLATTRRWNDRDGKPCEKTQWHRIVVWDSLPATFGFVEKYLRKGDRVYVEGEIDYRSYEDNGSRAGRRRSRRRRCFRRGRAGGRRRAGGAARRSTRTRRGGDHRRATPASSLAL